MHPRDLGAAGAALFLLLAAPVFGSASPHAGSLEAQESPGTGEASPAPEATRVMVRAVSRDAKIIGSGVGGARITVRDARSGEVLARGVQEGSTGDTRAIVTEPRERGSDVYDASGAAGFLAELDLDRPTRVRIEAEGPLGTPHATRQASKTLLLLPGEDVLGDGVILELHGFTVELLEPDAASSASGDALPVRARVTMLCGCPTEPGGLWDSDDYEIEARIVRDGVVLERAELAFAGERSTYRGEVRRPEGDDLVLQVVAAHSASANFGMVERPLGSDGTVGGPAAGGR